MTAKSYLRGQPIEYLNGQWVYSDTKEPTVVGYNTRVCGECGKHRTPEGHDFCLGTLNGVKNACCGHGETNKAYVQFLDNTCIRGKDALDVMTIMKRWNDVDE